MTRPTPNPGSPSALRSLSSLALLARYTAQEAPANERALTSLATVPADRQSLPAFARAQRLLPHNTIARRTWLWRLTARQRRR